MAVGRSVSQTTEMESSIKLTGQGIRDLNDRGPKKKMVAPTGGVPPDAAAVTAPDAVKVAGDVEPAAALAPIAEDATIPAAAHHG